MRQPQSLKQLRQQKAFRYWKDEDRDRRRDSLYDYVEVDRQEERSQPKSIFHIDFEHEGEQYEKDVVDETKWGAVGQIFAKHPGAQINHAGFVNEVEE